MTKPFFINPNEGYVLDSLSGTSLLVTKDGGLNWKSVINGKIKPLVRNGKIESFDSGFITGDHHFDGADFVYLNGYWYKPETGQFGDRYVMAFTRRINDGVATNPS